MVGKVLASLLGDCYDDKSDCKLDFGSIIYCNLQVL